ncbi:4Fe-4S binding protein [Candidatus Solincola sp.]|nr:4Fe-4S binding protein [Actinomycetota bacterium]MDI7251698.1 4Fe-4S binding protein [Actinomycetota bacterium]
MSPDIPGEGDLWRSSWEAAVDGAVAVVDCREEIPCNPCEEACPTGAIRVGPDICAAPRFDPQACNGCGRCVALCPGMAVFLLDRREKSGFARVTVPYEMGERPVEGEEVQVVDGEGKALTGGKILKIRALGGGAPTLLVTVRVPESVALKVRGVRYRLMERDGFREVDKLPSLADYPLCRCEDVPLERVRDILRTGLKSLPSLRRASRVGLGYCQGMFCQSSLRQELAEATGREGEEIGSFRVRPPVRPVKLGFLGGGNA